MMQRHAGQLAMISSFYTLPIDLFPNFQFRSPLGWKKSIGLDFSSYSDVKSDEF